MEFVIWEYRYRIQRSRLELYSWIKRAIWALSIQDLIVLKCQSMAKPCGVICHCVWLFYKALFDSKALQWKEVLDLKSKDPVSWPAHIKDAIHIDSNMSDPSWRSCKTVVLLGFKYLLCSLWAVRYEADMKRTN